MKNILSALILVALFLDLSVVCAQQEDDSTSINPDVCGLTSKKVAQLLQSREKRYTSSQIARNQQDWDWQIILANQNNNDFRGGSLINSQWVLSFAWESE
jgi:hypothetical protein